MMTHPDQPCWTQLQVDATWDRDIINPERNTMETYGQNIRKWVSLWLIGECNEFRRLYQMHWAIAISTSRKKSKPWGTLNMIPHKMSCLVVADWDLQQPTGLINHQSSQIKWYGFSVNRVNEPKQIQSNGEHMMTWEGCMGSCYKRSDVHHLQWADCYQLTLHHIQKAFRYHLNIMLKSNTEGKTN